MPFLTTMPISMSSPIHAMMLSGVRVAVRSHIAPGRANGIENRMANGWAIDSNNDAIAR